MSESEWEGNALPALDEEWVARWSAPGFRSRLKCITLTQLPPLPPVEPQPYPDRGFRFLVKVEAGFLRQTRWAVVVQYRSGWRYSGTGAPDHGAVRCAADEAMWKELKRQEALSFLMDVEERKEKIDGNA